MSTFSTPNVRINTGSTIHHDPRYSTKYLGVTNEGHLDPALAGIGADVIHALDVASNPKSTEAQIEKARITLQHRDIASDTYERPIGKAQVNELIHRYTREKRRVMSMKISPRDLNLLHPGSIGVANSDHLHPRQPGHSTKHFYSDEELLTIVWEYPEPKPGQIHPDPIQLTDGTLRAVFLTKDAPNMKEFENYQARMLDYVHGNKNAMNPSATKRAYYNTIYRFKSYFRGIHEGLSAPRYNGTIGSNLLLTSLPISAILYGVIYGIDYAITEHDMNKKQKHHHNDANNAYNNLNNIPPNLAITA